MDSLEQQTQALIARDFDLPNAERIFSEEELLALLSNEVADMIEHRLDFLLSLMYRLDVDELKIDHALRFGNEEPANVLLAKLILERQKQRVFTKNFYKQQPISNWEDFDKE